MEGDAPEPVVGRADVLRGNCRTERLGVANLIVTAGEAPKRKGPCTFPPPHPHELITFICRTGALLFIVLNVDDLRLVGPGSRGKGDLQEAEREKRKRQRIEPVVVVKEVV